MEQRPTSSPSHMASSPRPRAYRKRSNSFPIVDALGCSTPEAELILAEGRAAVRSRHPSRHGRSRRNKSENDQAMTFRPQEYMKYLQQSREVAVEEEEEEPVQTYLRATRHSRIPSNLTDRSGSTITGPTAPSTELTMPPRSPASPLGDYSANLAEFIKSQLKSIPSVAEFQAGAAQVQWTRQNGSHPMMHPQSCPDLSHRLATPPQSPTVLERRKLHLPSIVEMPSYRPPLKSEFSAWSSTDDEAEDEVLPLPGFELEQPRKDSHASNDTPSLLQYYQGVSGPSFLFSSTPIDEDKQQLHPNADGFSFPAPPGNTSTTHSPTSHEGYPSSTLSHPQLSSSSAPSFSSTSTASYFECKRPISIAPHLRDRIIAAVSPQHPAGKTLPAISPWEGGALGAVHDVFVESQNRVHVDGLSFDMVRDFSMPHEVAPRVQTPC